MLFLLGRTESAVRIFKASLPGPYQAEVVVQQLADVAKGPSTLQSGTEVEFALEAGKGAPSRPPLLATAVPVTEGIVLFFSVEDSDGSVHAFLVLKTMLCRFRRYRSCHSNPSGADDDGGAAHLL